MKILITTDCYIKSINGVVTSIINLKNGLEALGHEVRVLTLSDTKKNKIEGTDYYVASMKGDVIYPGVRIKLMPCPSIMQDICQWKPDVIHSQSEFSTFILAKRLARKLNIPLVHTYHTLYEDYTHYFSPSKTVGKKVVQKFTQKISKDCSAMIAPTPKVQSILEGYEIACPTFVVPSGIDLSKFQKKIPEYDTIKLRSKHAIDDDAVVFMVLGRVCKEKNIEELLHYFKHIKESRAVLCVVGGGPCLEQLQALAKTLQIHDKVVFTGMVKPEEVPQYYQMADVFVSASTSETQGLTYIEALASGLPILCRKDECLDDILHQGMNGFSYETEDEFLAYADFYCKHKDTFSENMVSNVRDSVRHLSKECFAARVESLYKEVMHKEHEEIKSGGKLSFSISIMSLIVFTLLTFYGYQKGWFTSIEALQQLVASVGIYAPMIFILLQISQVVMPVIPGGLGCLAGVILFGPLYGFLYNYIGICIGSLIVFGISKNFGHRVLQLLFSKQLILKYRNWTEKGRKFDKLFAWAIFMPVAPDDFLCYLAGTTNMSWKYFTGTIVTGKILSIAMYSLGLTVLWQQFTRLFW